MTTDVLVFTVGLVLMLRAISAGLKRSGFPADHLWLVELVLGVAAVEAGILAGALTVTGVAAGAPTLFYGAVYGGIAGLSAGGLYNATATATRTP